MCNKRAFSKEEAETALYQVRSRKHNKHFRKIHMERRKYFCKECNAFHLTKSKKRVYGKADNIS